MAEYYDDLQDEVMDMNNNLHSFCNDYLYRLAYLNLNPMNTDEFYEAQKDFKPYKAIQTPLKKVEKSEGVNAWLKFKAFFDDEAKKELEAKKKKAELSFDKIQKDEATRNKRLAEAYYKRQEEHNNYCDELKIRAKNNYQEPTIEYFNSVLSDDAYPVDASGDFQIDCNVDRYNIDTHTLCISYRLPDPSEIVGIKEFKIDKKNNDIIAVTLSKKDRAERNLLVMRLILIRVAALVYLSDTYKNIRNLRVIGFLAFYDEYNRRSERRDVVKMDFSRTNFRKIESVYLDIPTIDDLFDKMKSDKQLVVAPDLYKKEVFETRSLYE